MKCPRCQSGNLKVVDSRNKKDRRYRKRQCGSCGNRFVTTELIGTVSTNLPLLQPMIEKKNGKTDTFQREKLMQSILISLPKSSRDNVPIGEIVDEIEQEIGQMSDEPIKTTTIGEKVLDALRRYDSLAYIRYLSVHQRMESANDIQLLIDELEQVLKTSPDAEKEERGVSDDDGAGDEKNDD